MRNQMKLKVSIIIPVYNGEMYLKECIGSVCEQTYTNFELILINDGSTDNSLSICEEFSKKDNRIVVINKENTGVSHTRNYGIDFASGDYISFVDCDDCLHKGFLEQGINEISKNKAELVICGYQTFDANGIIEQQIPSIYFLGNNERFVSENFKDLVEKSILYATWGKLIKSDIIKKNNIRFDESYSICEDAMFSIDILSRCNLICVMKKGYYYYRRGQGSSLSSRYHANSFEGLFRLYEKYTEYLVKANANKDMVQYNKSIFLTKIIYFIIMLYYASGEPAFWCYKRIKNLYKNDSFLYIMKLKYGSVSRKEKIVLFLMKNRMVFILHLMMLLRYRGIKQVAEHKKARGA